MKEPIPFFWPLLAALLIWAGVAFLFTSCSTMPSVTFIGEYGDYSYSAKSGITVRSKITNLIIHADK